MIPNNKIILLLFLIFVISSNVCAQNKKKKDKLPKRFIYTIQINDQILVKGYRIKGYPVLFVPLTKLIKHIPGNQLKGYKVVKIKNFFGFTVIKKGTINKIDFNERLVFIKIDKWIKKKNKGIEEEVFFKILREEIEDSYSIQLIKCASCDSVSNKIEPESFDELENRKEQVLTDVMAKLEELEDLKQFESLVKDSSQCIIINPLQLGKTRVQLKVDEKRKKLLKKKRKMNQKWQDEHTEKVLIRKQIKMQSQELERRSFRLDSILDFYGGTLSDSLKEAKSQLPKEINDNKKRLKKINTQIDQLEVKLGRKLTLNQFVQLEKYRNKQKKKMQDQYLKMQGKFDHWSQNGKINDKRYYKTIIKSYNFYKRDSIDLGLKHFVIRLAISEITGKFPYPDKKTHTRIDNSTTLFLNALAKYNTYTYHKRKENEKPQYLNIAYRYADTLMNKLQKAKKADQLNKYESKFWNRYIRTDFEDEARKLIGIITSELACESLKRKAKEYENEQMCWEALALYKEAMKICCPNEVLFKKVERILTRMDKFYSNAVFKADSFFTQGDYLCAAKLYIKASQIKPMMVYPKGRMIEALDMANEIIKAQMDKMRYNNLKSFIYRLIQELLQRYEYNDLPNNEFDFPSAIKVQEDSFGIQLNYGMASTDLSMFAYHKEFIPGRYRAEKTARFINEVIYEIHHYLGDLIIGTSMRIEGHADGIPYRGNLKFNKKDFSRPIDDEVTITNLGKGQAYTFKELLAKSKEEGDVNPSLAHIREIYMRLKILDANEFIKEGQDSIIAVSKWWEQDIAGDKRRTNVALWFKLDSIRYQKLNESDLDTMNLPCKDDALISPCVDYFISDTLINNCNRIKDSKRRKGGKYYALLIAVDQYKEELTNNRVLGAKALYDVLTSEYDFDSENVYTLYDEDATLQAIEDNLKYLESKIVPQDNLLIYFSGQGEFYLQEKQGYWLPYDAVNLPQKKKVKNGLSNQMLQKYLKENKAQHILVIIESSNSGSLIQQGKSTYSQMSLPKLYSTKSRAAFSSNGTLEKSPKDGVFTNKLINILQSIEEDCFEARKLALEVKKVLEDNSKYHPQYGKVPLTLNINDLLKGEGDFVFIRRAE